MAITITNVVSNADWDFRVDSDGLITAVFLSGSVTYENNGESFTRVERRNIWPNMSETLKSTLQNWHDAGSQWFKSHKIIEE